MFRQSGVVLGSEDVCLLVLGSTGLRINYICHQNFYNQQLLTDNRKHEYESGHIKNDGYKL